MRESFGMCSQSITNTTTGLIITDGLSRRDKNRDDQHFFSPGNPKERTDFMTKRSFDPGKDVKLGGGRLGQSVSLILVLFLTISSPAFGQIVLDSQNVDDFFESDSPVGTATVGPNSGYLLNNSDIGTAHVYGRGFVTNYGTINTVTVYDSNGNLNNSSGTITTANINNGWIANQETATIHTMFLNDGIVANFGRIENLIYTQGLYFKEYVDLPGVTGTIGTLTIAGKLYASNDWGGILNLKFDSNGSGCLVLTGYANEPTPLIAPASMGLMGVIPISTTSTLGILFDSFNVENSVDLTCANLVLDLSKITGYSEEDLLAELFGGGLSFANLFGTDNIRGVEEIANFSIDLGDGIAKIIEDYKIVDGYILTSTGLVYDGGDATVPEPATILMLSLGLAGAGLAARRKMRNKK